MSTTSPPNRKDDQSGTHRSGAETLADASGAVHDGVVAEVLVSVPAVSIAGGTDEIQRNIIGERVLGLPKEPSVDRDMPFRSIPRNHF